MPGLRIASKTGLRAAGSSWQAPWHFACNQLSVVFCEYPGTLKTARAAMAKPGKRTRKFVASGQLHLTIKHRKQHQKLSRAKKAAAAAAGECMRQAINMHAARARLLSAADT